LMWIEPATPATFHLQLPTPNLPYPAPWLMTHNHPTQLIHCSFHAPCCSIKHLHEGTHTVNAWYIFEIWNMNYEIWNMKHGTWERKAQMSWCESSRRLLSPPATSCHLQPLNPNIQHPTSHPLHHGPWPMIYNPSPITNNHLDQSIHHSFYPPCCSIKHLHEGTHIVDTWYIFEIWAMNYELWNMKQEPCNMQHGTWNMKMKMKNEKWRRKAHMSWCQSNQWRLPPHPTSNLQPTTSHTLWPDQ
jgi:hypothetical protein